MDSAAVGDVPTVVGVGGVGVGVGVSVGGVGAHQVRRRPRGREVLVKVLVVQLIDDVRGEVHAGEVDGVTAGAWGRGGGTVL